MAGRQSSSVRSRTLSPVVFSKSGTQTAALLAERHYNITNAPQRIQSVVASVNTAPTGATLTVDCLINGVSVFNAAGDRAAIPISGFVSPAAVPTKTDADAVTLAPGEYLQVEVKQIGSTVAGADLRVQVQLG